MNRSVRFAMKSEDLQREGLKETPEAWEDGLRTNAGPGSIEWWYFDAHFEDGSTAVIVFMTKPIVELNAPLKPVVQITITRPDGKRLSHGALIAPETLIPTRR